MMPMKGKFEPASFLKTMCPKSIWIKTSAPQRLLNPADFCRGDPARVLHDANDRSQ